jgi:hypothetical protein
MAQELRERQNYSIDVSIPITMMGFLRHIWGQLQPLVQGFIWPDGSSISSTPEKESTHQLNFTATLQAHVQLTHMTVAASLA